MNHPLGLAASLAALAALGCGAPEPPGSTGGTHATPGACGRGVGVVHTDESYASSNVSLLDWQGQVLSSSFISSATTDAKLSAKLTGDVVLPTSPTTGDRLVLIDRYPASVITWVDIETAKVSAQLSVRSGFAANPHDYLALDETRALVTRFGKNPDPDAGPLDRGDDVLVLDVGVPAPVASIDLSPALADAGAGFHASPHRMVAAGERVVVSLLGHAADYSDAAPSRLAVIDPKAGSVGQVLVLDGLYECNGLALAPDEQSVAVSCSGRFHGGSEPDASESAVAIVKLGPTLEETARWPADGEAPFAFTLAWPSAGTLVATTFGSESPARPDTLVELDLATGARRTLLESQGEPFTLSDVSCAAACSTCFASDAGRGVVHAFAVDASGRLGAPSAIDVNDAIGLPPRWLGRF